MLALGPSETSKEIRTCLAKGADRGVLVVDDAWASRDCRSTAVMLADAIRKSGAELVFTGRLATDRDNAAVGPMVATLLGWACVTDVIELDVGADGSGTAKRESEAGVEHFQFSLPAVITCQKDLNEPRFAALKGIMAAKKKPIEEVPCEAVEGQTEVVGVSLPPPRPEGRIVGEGVDAVAPLMEALRNEAKVL